MSAEKSSQVQSAFYKSFQEIDRIYLRKIQKEMFECSTKCCDSEIASIEQVNQCLAKCSIKFNESHNYCTERFNNFQERLQRCVNQCNDEAKDCLGTQPTEKQVEKASKLFEICASSCIDKQMEILPQLVKQIQEVLNQKILKKNSSFK